MTIHPTLILKNPKGWFAAGQELERAVTVLSDGAFKLFVYVCLNARRDTGCLETVQGHLAESLSRSRGSIARQLRELKTMGVCQVRGYHSPRGATWIEVTPDYWPYQRATDAAPDEAAGWVAEVRELFLARPCVRASFSTADERLARSWLSRGISLEGIGQAILLGCARKYTTWRNGQDRSTIGSLSYFEPILEELATQPPNSDYWQYVQAKVDRMERQWVVAHSNRKVASPEDRAPGTSAL
jgi:hypothetical protein